MVIIYTNVVDFESLMLHAKFPDSNLEIFEVFFPYMNVAPSWSCDLDHLYILFPPSQRGFII